MSPAWYKTMARYLNSENGKLLTLAWKSMKRQEREKLALASRIGKRCVQCQSHFQNGQLSLDRAKSDN